MLIGIHHTAISTPDLKRLKQFYCDLFGFEEIFGFEWRQGSEISDRIVGLKDSSAEFVFLRNANTHLELFEYRSPTPRPRDPAWRVCDHGLTHICFEVSDIHSEYSRLKNMGMRFQAAPCAAAGLMAVYGRDPDGNIVELIEFVKPPTNEQHSLSLAVS